MTDDTENWYAEDAATLGDRLAAAREAAGLTQVQLAAKLGVKADTVDAWENDRREPRANRLQMLTGLLGVSLGWLLTGVGEGPDELTDPETTPEDVKDLLIEMRELQTQIMTATIKLADLEKRLRKAII